MVHAGEEYELCLVRKHGTQRYMRGTGHVYVFVIDGAGVRHLLHPDFARQGESMRFDAGPPNDEAPIPLGARIQIEPPFGVDSYFLLATDRPVPDLRIFEDDSGARGAGDGRLSALLNDLRTGTRGARQTPERWSLDRLTLVSRP